MKVTAGWLELGYIFISPLAPAEAQSIPKDYKEYAKSLKDKGYAAVLPASTAYRPGYVYELIKGADGIVSANRVCRLAFEGRPSFESEAPPAGAKVSDKSFSLTLAFVPPEVAKSVSADFGINWSKVTKSDLALDVVTKWTAPDLKQYDAATGKVITRKIRPECEERLRDLDVKVGGKLKSPLFLVLNAYAVDKLSYKFEAAGSFGINLGGQATSSLKAKTGWTAKKTNNQSLVLANAASPKLDADGYPQVTYFAALVMRIDRLSEFYTRSPGQKDWDITLATPAQNELDFVP